MSMDPFDESFEQFDIEDFDEDFDEDFEAEIAGEYELENNEYQDFDDPNLIPAVDFCGERDDDEEEPAPVEEAQAEADPDAAPADEAPAPTGKAGKKAGK